MKLIPSLIIFSLVVLVSLKTRAQNQTLTWENSLKREFEFIDSQKKALKFQIQELEKNYDKEMQEISKKNETLRKDNLSLKEEILIWNNKNEEIKKWQSFKIEKFASRINKLHKEILNSVLQKNSSFKENQINRIDDFKNDFLSLAKNIDALTQTRLIPTTILNIQQSLEEGTILALGPLISFKVSEGLEAQTSPKQSLAGKSFFLVLIPSEFGYLNNSSIKNELTPIAGRYFKTNAFIYDNFSKSYKLLKEKNFADKLADFLPAAFLLLVFSFVGWIFLVLTKV